MDSFLFITLLVVISASILAYTLAKNGGLRDRTRLIFFFFIITHIVFVIFSYYSIQRYLEDYTIWIIRVSMVNAVSQTILVYLFAKNFPNKKFVLSKKLILVCSITYMAVALVCISPLLFSKVVWVEDLSHVIPGPGVYLFGATTFYFIIAATFELIKKYRNTHGIIKNQILYLLIGEITMFAFLFLLNFVIVVWFGNYFFIQFGGLPVLFFIALTTYAVTRYRLFGIKFILQKFVINSLTFLAPLLLYGLIAFIVYESPFSLQQPSNVYVNLLIAAVVVATFNPIRNFVRKFLTKLFERQPALKPELIQAAQSGNNQAVITQIISQYLPWLTPNQVGIMMFRSDNSLYTFYPQHEQLIPTTDEALVRLMQGSAHSMVVTEELGWQIEQGDY